MTLVVAGGVREGEGAVAHCSGHWGAGGASLLGWGQGQAIDLKTSQGHRPDGATHTTQELVCCPWHKDP